MHGPIHNHLQNGAMEMLNKLGKEIIEKREALMPAIGWVEVRRVSLTRSERTFRIPVRVTYNDVKRAQFIAELANPGIPLKRMMRQPVPHGFKGVELLETLFSPSTSSALGPQRSSTLGGVKLPSEPIEIDRAVWFIRVLGANEIHAHRARSQTTATVISAPSPAAATPSSTTTNQAQTTIPLTSNEWWTQELTNTFTGWMRTQLAHLSLPAPTKGAQLPKGLGNPLADTDIRARWLKRWGYRSVNFLESLLRLTLKVVNS